MRILLWTHMQMQWKKKVRRRKCRRQIALKSQRQSKQKDRSVDRALSLCSITAGCNAICNVAPPRKRIFTFYVITFQKYSMSTCKSNNIIRGIKCESMWLIYSKFEAMWGLRYLIWSTRSISVPSATFLSSHVMRLLIDAKLVYFVFAPFKLSRFVRI